MVQVKINNTSKKQLPTWCQVSEGDHMIPPDAEYLFARQKKVRVASDKYTQGTNYTLSYITNQFYWYSGFQYCSPVSCLFSHRFWWKCYSLWASCCNISYVSTHRGSNSREMVRHLWKKKSSSLKSWRNISWMGYFSYCIIFTH